MIVKGMSSAAQRQRILKALFDQGSLTTLDIRHQLSIMSPAPRIFELRRSGYSIASYPVDVRDCEGNLHKGVARYVLQGLPEAANDD